MGDEVGGEGFAEQGGGARNIGEEAAGSVGQLMALMIPQGLIEHVKPAGEACGTAA